MNLMSGWYFRKQSSWKTIPPPPPSLHKRTTYLPLWDTRILLTNGSEWCGFLSSPLYHTCMDKTVLSFSGMLFLLLVCFRWFFLWFSNGLECFFLSIVCSFRSMFIWAARGVRVPTTFWSRITKFSLQFTEEGQFLFQFWILAGFEGSLSILYKKYIWF